MSTTTSKPKGSKRGLGIAISAILILAVIIASVVTVQQLTAKPKEAPEENPVVFSGNGFIKEYDYAFFGDDTITPRTMSTTLESTIEIDGTTHTVVTSIDASMSVDAALALFDRRAVTDDPIEYEGKTSITFPVLQDALSQLVSAIEVGSVREIAYQTFGAPIVIEPNQDVIDSYLLEQEQKRIEQEEETRRQEAIIKECLELGIDPCLGPLPAKDPSQDFDKNVFVYRHTCVSYAVAAINTRDFYSDVDRLFADVEGIWFKVETSIELDIETELPCDGWWETTQSTSGTSTNAGIADADSIPAIGDGSSPPD